MIHLVMQRLPRTYNRLMSKRLLEVKSHLSETVRNLRFDSKQKTINL